MVILRVSGGGGLLRAAARFFGLGVAEGEAVRVVEV